MASYIFKTPTIQEGPIGTKPPFNRGRLHRGISIVKLGGTYSQVRNLDSDLIPTYSEYYQGGGTFTVSDAVRTALIAGGVGVDASNFTII